jgi:hypothetical protein
MSDIYRVNVPLIRNFTFILPQIPRVFLHPKDVYYAGIPPDMAKALSGKLEWQEVSGV